MTRLLVGVDFDNTLVCYDALLHREATARGLIPIAVPADKRRIRDQIRRRPHGEADLQRLQALIYGEKIQDAPAAPGVPEFFSGCRQDGIAVAIVSHKTAELHAPALAWLERHGAFESSGWGVSRASIYFESTRVEKLTRIRQIGCTHFVDDLEETFAEPAFPPGVRKILYAPHGLASTAADATLETWPRIAVWINADVRASGQPGRHTRALGRCAA